MRQRELNIILNDPHEAILFAEERFKILNAGRGFGKTQLFLADMFTHMGKRYTDAYGLWMPNRMYYCAPLRKQAETIFWERSCEFFSPMIHGRPNKSTLAIKMKNKSLLQLFGSNNPDGMLGTYLTRFYADEAAYHKNLKKILNKTVRPMLDRVRPYGGSLLGSTPNGKDFFYELASKGIDGEPGYAYYHHISTDGGFVDDGAVIAAKADFTYEQWRQEYFAEFINPTNMVYFKFGRDKHCRKINHVPELTIHWAWDFNVKPAVHSTLSHEHKSKIFVFDEIAVGNTPNNVEEFCERYPKDKVSEIKLYGDYNGTYSTTGTTDFMEIQKTLADRGYPFPELCVYGGNPIVRSRTNNVNRLLEDANQDIRLYVNPDKCPRLVRDMEQVRWSEKSADIDKTSDPTLTHASDGLGYQLWVTHPPEWATPSGKPQRTRPKDDKGWWT